MSEKCLQLDLKEILKAASSGSDKLSWSVSLF